MLLCGDSLLLCHALLAPLSLALYHFLVQQRLDADPASLGPEMSSESISTGETPSTTPLPTSLQVALADELLLARVEALVTLAIMLSRKGFATDCANEWSLVGVSPQV